jgi:hypothetical protein
MSNFDIRTLAISKTGEVPVRNASGEKQYDADGKLLSITVHSPGTKAFNAAAHARQLRNSDRMVNKMQGRADGKQTAEDSIEERAEFLAAITISFNNFSVEGLTGKAAFAKIYGDLELGHIADDVEKFVGDRANFIRPSTTDL